ncbi:hypothetical protein P9112_013434 [Eukaryota sp. TZLM1-RC]
MVDHPDSFLCMVHRGLLLEPRALPCGHSFCLSCIEEWLGLNQTCPSCRTAVSLHNVTRNYQLEDLMKDVLKPYVIQSADLAQLSLLKRTPRATIHAAELNQREVIWKQPYFSADDVEVVREVVSRVYQVYRTLNSPTQVVSVLGVTLDPPGIVQECLSCSLQDLFNQKRVLNALEAFLVIEEVSQAVSCFHLAGFVHRDVSAGNVLLKLRGQAIVSAKLGDFDDSRACDVTLTQMTLGTVAYMAPEVLFGELRKAHSEVDIFSLGVLFWGILANTDPSKVVTNPAQLQVSRISSHGAALINLDKLLTLWRPLIASMVSLKAENRPKIETVLQAVRNASLNIEELDRYQLQPANSSIESLQKQITDLESINQQLNTILEERDARIARLEKEKNAVEQAYNATIAPKNAEIAILRSSINELEKQNTLLSKTNSDLASRIADLEALLRECHCNQPLNNIDDHHPPSKEEILEDIKSNVNWNGLVDGVKKGVEGLVDGSITKLNLQFNKITSEGASALARALESNSTLTKLNLGDNKITSEGASALARALESNSTMTELNLGNNNITSEGASALARALESNSTLTTLYLQYNNFPSEGASALARALESNSTLTKLNLGDNKITSEGASALARALESNSTLTTLDLQYNNFTSEGASALAHALESNSTLTKLNLGNNNITSEGASALARALESNSTLTTLYLQSNNITSEGASALARALESNSTLTELNLQYNNITSEGASALARALESNSTLTELNLGNNNITSEGASALARALESNSTLTELNLWNNNITSEGASALARALESNSTLTELNLWNNNITSEGASALALALESNSSLTKLNLGGNNISNPTKSKLRQIESNRASLNIFF